MAINEDRGRLTQLVFGQMAGQVVATAADLGLADLIGDGERSGTELAGKIDADPGAVTRLLRALAALGLLTETTPDSFALTGMGTLLRSDGPDSLLEFVRMFSDPAMLAAWRELGSAVRTGHTTFDQVFGVSFFDHLAANPELSARFNTSMRQATQLVASALPASYHFGRFHTVLDIGGGDGTLLTAVLGAHPGLRGVVYDTASGLAQAGATFQQTGLADRCTTTTGDFFTSVPGGADLYLIKSIVHDWNDDQVNTILGHCRRVIPDNGRLLIIEPVLPEKVDGSVRPGLYLSDLNMLVNVGGRERTLVDFDLLCARAGFTLSDLRLLPGPSGFSLIEATPA
ncbi:methyltransferase [Pseudonocardia spinosispora]|uniref:methyltransferase n=1 Tax=Pseudonocardia spinosispora TaxID=103441 RepID=UPI0004266134|nr:methyltransferase [Pseudonocardia spinosispora]